MKESRIHICPICRKDIDDEGCFSIFSCHVTACRRLSDRNDHSSSCGEDESGEEEEEEEEEMRAVNTNEHDRKTSCPVCLLSFPSVSSEAEIEFHMEECRRTHPNCSTVLTRRATSIARERKFRQRREELMRSRLQNNLTNNTTPKLDNRRSSLPYPVGSSVSNNRKPSRRSVGGYESHEISSHTDLLDQHSVESGKSKPAVDVQSSGNPTPDCTAKRVGSSVSSNRKPSRRSVGGYESHEISSHTDLLDQHSVESGKSKPAVDVQPTGNPTPDCMAKGIVQDRMDGNMPDISTILEKGNSSIERNKHIAVSDDAAKGKTSLAQRNTIGHLLNVNDEITIHSSNNSIDKIINGKEKDLRITDLSLGQESDLVLDYDNLQHSANQNSVQNILPTLDVKNIHNILNLNSCNTNESIVVDGIQQNIVTSTDRDKYIASDVLNSKSEPIKAAQSLLCNSMDDAKPTTKPKLFERTIPMGGYIKIKNSTPNKLHIDNDDNNVVVGKAAGCYQSEVEQNESSSNFSKPKSITNNLNPIIESVNLVNDNLFDQQPLSKAVPSACSDKNRIIDLISDDDEDDDDDADTYLVERPRSLIDEKISNEVQTVSKFSGKINSTVTDDSHRKLFHTFPFCYICGVFSIQRPVVKCTGGCNRLFHPLCIELPLENICESSWKCAECSRNVHECFRCEMFGVGDDIIQCCVTSCGVYYHKKCFSTVEKVECARQRCAECGRKIEKDRLIHCVRCYQSCHISCFKSAKFTVLEGQFALCEKHEGSRALNPKPLSLFSSNIDGFCVILLDFDHPQSVHAVNYWGVIVSTEGGPNLEDQLLIVKLFSDGSLISVYGNNVLPIFQGITSPYDQLIECLQIHVQNELFLQCYDVLNFFCCTSKEQIEIILRECCAVFQSLAVEADLESEELLEMAVGICVDFKIQGSEDEKNHHYLLVNTPHRKRVKLNRIAKVKPPASTPITVVKNKSSYVTKEDSPKKNIFCSKKVKEPTLSSSKRKHSCSEISPKHDINRATQAENIQSSRKRMKQISSSAINALENIVGKYLLNDKTRKKKTIGERTWFEQIKRKQHEMVPFMFPSGVQNFSTCCNSSNGRILNHLDLLLQLQHKRNVEVSFWYGFDQLSNSTFLSKVQDMPQSICIDLLVFPYFSLFLTHIRNVLFKSGTEADTHTRLVVSFNTQDGERRIFKSSDDWQLFQRNVKNIQIIFKKKNCRSSKK